MARSVSKTWESEIAYNHGVADERERIIKLLKNKLSPITYEQHECVSIEDVLAAIKGENK
jgi:hypothetical protein